MLGSGPELKFLHLGAWSGVKVTPPLEKGLNLMLGPGPELKFLHLGAWSEIEIGGGVRG